MNEQPNILFIMTDQQRYDSLGCYGFEAGHTPNLDRLGSEGVVFEHCYVNNPICTPSRASMFTGKELPGHGVYRLYDNLPDDEVLFTRRLQDLGYQTALFGKLHVSAVDYEVNKRHPNDGFDVYEPCIESCLRMDAPFQAYSRWLETNHPEFHARLSKDLRQVLHHPQEVHLTRWAADRTINFIEHRDSEKPFFAMMSIFDPHNPYEDYPQEMADLIDPAKIPDPLVREGEFEGKPDDLVREHRASYLGDFQNFSPEDLQKMRFGYHASLAFADQEIGRVLDALEQNGIADNTLVIFTSDHGDMLGDHSLLVKGAFFYDPNTRVPLIMRWPRQLQSGERASGLVQLHDLAATVLAAAGMNREDLDGCMPDSCDLVPLGRGDRERVRDTAVCCYRNSGLTRGGYWDPPIHATMFRDERFKLNIWHDAAGAGRGLQGELYDMEEDPLELNNLWNQPSHAVVRAGLMEHAMEWTARQERERGSRGGETKPAKLMKNTLKTGNRKESWT